MDSLGNRQVGDDGVLMCSIEYSGFYQYTNVVPDNNNGMILVFQKDYEYDVWAKRANLDGTLGGPNAPIEEVNIMIDDSSAVLTWPAMADSAQYHIYKSTDPYSFPALPDTTISDTVYIDVDAVNEGMKFYRVSWEVGE
ncbi:MAG: hypothetical protein H8E87_02565 [FCB group bacterium]|nr:hypothetical protein [FCB group bacterium]